MTPAVTQRQGTRGHTGGGFDRRRSAPQASQRADAAPHLPPSSERTRCHTRYTRCPGGRTARCAPPPQQNHAVSAIRMYPTLCVAAARGRGGGVRRHQRHTCLRQMCATLRDREVMHDLVVGAAFGRAIEDFATRRWRGRRRPNGGFWGFGAVGPQDRKREKRALHDPILT